MGDQRCATPNDLVRDRPRVAAALRTPSSIAVESCPSRRLQHFHCRCLSTTAAGLADFVRSLLD
jgi:hypothetical protein